MKNESVFINNINDLLYINLYMDKNTIAYDAFRASEFENLLANNN